ncbi:B3 domain-containing transcription factor VRN1-like isoform X1 [Humulus lupulus]|uniref:B3 domain-containing transcription factor VRN1-like isoform X1 n=1 Tax=Humulus lupulus TaxID=3486 RepID=UPI002B409964|nr:B3 domain-containing transcription factor VRN1-like isoform X1 [Humulus lupulus]XP_062102237.1 B3 domain-containing transcription factor VRN1-like isoform X1 [Humulus lupulus]
MACASQRAKVQTKFSPTFPHFFRIVLEQSFGNKLQIPKTFWRKYCGSLSSQVFLELPCGSRWEVGLTKSSDGKVWIEKGWKNFAEHCSLGRGNLLIFRYKGNSQFNVIIFDNTTVEIDYPFNPNHIEKYVDIDEDDASTEDSDFSWYPKTRDKSPLPCSRSHKQMKTSPYGKSEVKFDWSDNLCEEPSLPRWMEPQNFIRKQKLGGKEKAEALMRAKHFKSNDPFFIVPMQPSFVGSAYNMVIPFFFAKYYLLNISNHQDVILKVQNGRTWPVKYYYRHYKGHSKIRFECGWRAFAQDNNLKVGDVCVFVMRKSIGIMLFEVVIFYKNGEASSPMLPAANKGRTTTPCVPKRNPCVKVEPSFTSNYEKASMISQDLTAKKEIVEPSGLSRASEAASQFFSKNPYFQVNVRSTQVHGHRLYIPLTFARLYLEGNAKTFTLWVGEEYWHVKLMVNGSEYRFSAGWTAFARENYLQPSDVCIFELIKRNQPEMKVTIFRQSGLAQEL